MPRRVSRLAQLSLAVLVLATTAWSARADEGLSAVYAAILRGDPDGGQAQLQQLRAAGASPAEVARVESWLDTYRGAVATRAEMKAETFRWNLDQGKQALSAHDVYFALSFAVQAQAYAPDAKAFSAEPWVQELTAQAEARASQAETEQRWTTALATYSMLARIHPGNKHWEELRDDAARHVRLEVLYKDESSLQKRIKDVRPDLLSNAIKQINKDFYEEPDFKRMAEGALQNLITLAETKKVYDFLHGLGNPVTRDFFENALRDALASVRAEERYNHKDLIKLYKRIAAVNTQSVELPEGLLIVEFLEGAVQRLDQFTAMVWPADAVDFDKMMMGGFEGVGIQLGLDERTSRLKVVTPLEDSPALEAGIQPGDLITEVDGKSTQGWNTDDAVNNIMGKSGTAVTLTLFRPGTGERLSLKLVRRRIVLRTVRGVERKPDDPQQWNYMLDRAAGIAYVRLSGFHPDSHDELVKALKQAEREGMRGLVLDLRNNPGGLLDVAVRIVSTFLREGEVVSTNGRSDPRASQRVTDEPYVTDVPLVVLVNEQSASASEILAGALKDHNRAVVLGERTYGKGSVQRVVGIGGEKARIKLTTSLYYLPSGRSPHKAPEAQTWGVDPNWSIRLTPKELRQVIQRENEASVIHNEAASKPGASEVDREKALDELKHEAADKDEEPPLLTDAQIKALEADPVKVSHADAQLETALLLLRVKLAGNLPWPTQWAAKPDKGG